MQVLQMCLINDNGKPGYLAVLDSVAKDGRHNAVKFISTRFGSGFPVCRDTSAFKVKTVRSLTEFSKYMKLFTPAVMINPVRAGNLVFDLPFLHYPNGVVVQWRPHFEESVSEKSFSLISGGMIVEYCYQQPIFISALHMRRHVSAFNSERLLVNMSNGYTTRELNAVDGEVYCEGCYHVENGVWVCDKLNKTPIAGWKVRAV